MRDYAILILFHSFRPAYRECAAIPQIRHASTRKFSHNRWVSQFITGDALSRLQASHLGHLRYTYQNTSANYIDPLSLSRMTFASEVVRLELVDTRGSFRMLLDSIMTVCSMLFSYVSVFHAVLFTQ